MGKVSFCSSCGSAFENENMCSEMVKNRPKSAKGVQSKFVCALPWQRF